MIKLTHFKNRSPDSQSLSTIIAGGGAAWIGSVIKARRPRRKASTRCGEEHEPVKHEPEQAEERPRGRVAKLMAKLKAAAEADEKVKANSKDSLFR